MRRRLDPVATLVAQPEVLFLDEPTTGLYPGAPMELWTVLDILVDRGTVTTLSDALRVYFGNPKRRPRPAIRGPSPIPRRTRSSGSSVSSQSVLRWPSPSTSSVQK